MYRRSNQGIEGSCWPDLGTSALSHMSTNLTFEILLQVDTIIVYYRTQYCCDQGWHSFCIVSILANYRPISIMYPIFYSNSNTLVSAFEFTLVGYTYRVIAWRYSHSWHERASYLDTSWRHLNSTSPWVSSIWHNLNIWRSMFCLD